MLDINNFIQKGVQALIFDLDGTLADTMPIHMKAWLKVGEVFNIPVTEADIYRLTGSPTKEVALTLAVEYGWDIDADAIAASKQQFFTQYKREHGRISGIPIVEATARFFHGRLPMAIGTGSRKDNALEIIQDMDMMSFFSAVISANDVRNPKPHPETFLKCAEQMNIPPEHCLVFEDGDYGIQAAIDGGMHYFDVRPYLPIN